MTGQPTPLVEVEATVGLPSDFDSTEYLLLNPDVAQAGVDPVQHYLDYGIAENRHYKSNDRALEEHLAKFINIEPAESNAFEIFSNAWSSRLVSESGEKLTNGTFNGADDERIKWLFTQLKLQGLDVLELGPLEAAHTLMLEREGANVLAVESNLGAFLRCLVVKNQFSLKSKFLLGDFTQLKFGADKYDLVLASGVLYHMSEPVDLIRKMSQVSDRLFLWTHYFEEDLSLWNPNLQTQLDNGKWNYKEPEITEFDGLSISIIKQQYGDALGWSGFCGGPEDYSYWMKKQDLLALLEKLGYARIEIAFDDVTHQNGPSFCVYAEK